MPDAPVLTPAQQRAIESDSHTVLIANAGSGKTFTLVAHYIHLLEHDHGITPAEIAAITFTDNAAGELREKITEGILKRIEFLSELSADPAIVDRLWKALQEIDSAPISTIHGFCSRLLREHPIEAGIDPASGIIMGVERNLLVEESVDRVLHDTLQQIYREPSSDTHGMQSTFNLFGRGKIHGWIRQFLDHRFQTAKAIESLREKTDAELDEQTIKLFEEALADRLSNSAAQSGLQTLRTYFVTSADADTAAAALDLLLKSKTSAAQISNAGAFLDAILTKDDKPLSSVFSKRGKNGVSNVEAAAAILSDELSPLVDLREALTDAAAWQTGAPHSFVHLRNLLSLYEASLEEYSGAKLSQALLDHDDLIDYGVRLLAQEHVAAEIASSLRYCFVDEYQDTDDRQFRLLELITQNFTNHVRVTIVGDPKQSIYRFRDADLDVFRRTVGILTTAGETDPIKLDVCFRMLPAPLTVANRVTDHVFGADAELSEKYFYGPLVTARKESSEGSASILIAREDKDEPDALSEEELVARSIVQRHVQDDGGRYANMAILLRDRKRLGALEIALRHHAIPYSLSSGLGFYQQQEVIDALTLLNVLIDPSDELYLVALLRSPYFEFDDRTIWNLMHARNSLKPRPSLWEYLHDVSSQLPDHLRMRLDWLTRLVPFTGRTDTVTLLERAISESQIELTYLAFADGEQKISNLRKLVALAAKNELPIWEFVEQCRILQEHDDREQQAVQPTDDAVHIMTIHASKGLEFPIVFLPFLADPGRKRPSGSLLTRHFPNVILESYETSEPLRHPFSTLAGLHESDEEREEELRILYVALTRTKDEVIFSATLDKKGSIPARSQFALITNALGVDTAHLAASDSVSISHPLSRFADGRMHTEILDVDIPIARHVDLITPIALTETLPAPTHIILQQLPPARGVTRYSPTQLLTYRDCPTKYALRYDLGFPENVEELTEYEPAEASEGASSSLYGKLLHSVFEKIERFAGATLGTFKLDDDEFARITLASGVPERQLATYRKRLETEIARALGETLFQDIAGAKESYSELPLRYGLTEHFVLSGILDRLFRSESGEWNVVDYKTTRRPAPSQMEHYGFQTKLYAFLVFKLFDCSSVQAHLYFTSSGETISKTYSDIDLAGFDDELRTTIEEIVRGRSAKSLTEIEKVRTHCPDCPYSEERGTRCIIDRTAVSIS